jgi:hypothetical protein
VSDVIACLGVFGGVGCEHDFPLVVASLRLYLRWTCLRATFQMLSIEMTQVVLETNSCGLRRQLAKYAILAALEVGRPS